MPTNYTLTYSNGVSGWPSFYSYEPDFMVGMNSYFYTSYQGNLYRHNVNETRNEYYGSTYPSSVTTVFAQNPLENKIFKTISLQSNQSWEADLSSDQQSANRIESTEFEEKEGQFWGFVRADGSPDTITAQYALRSANGIGSSTSIDTTVTAAVEINFTVDTGSIISIGDGLYSVDAGVPTFVGTITGVSANQIIVDATAGTVPIVATLFYMYIKNGEAESHGLLGHYAEVTLTNSSTTAVELFAVESEVMKSFP